MFYAAVVTSFLSFCWSTSNIPYSFKKIKIKKLWGRFSELKLNPLNIFYDVKKNCTWKNINFGYWLFINQVITFLNYWLLRLPNVLVINFQIYWILMHKLFLDGIGCIIRLFLNFNALIMKNWVQRMRHTRYTIVVCHCESSNLK